MTTKENTSQVVKYAWASLRNEFVCCHLLIVDACERVDWPFTWVPMRYFPCLKIQGKYINVLLSCVL